MMSDIREPSLEAMFSEANRDLEGEAMTAQVMAGTRNRLVRKAAIALVGTIVVLLATWYVFAGSLLEFAVLISRVLTNPLVDLGEGWLALAFMAVNNIASLSVLVLKGGLLAWKKLTGSTLIR